MLSGKDKWIKASIAVVSLALVAGVTTLVAVQSSTRSASAVAPATILPLGVAAISPSNQSQNVAPSASITLQLTTALAASTPMPTLNPPILGSWSRLSPSNLEFVADQPLIPGSSETVTVPGGPKGILGAQGQHLANSVTSTFSVAQATTLRLQQLLAELGYLPLTFTPTSQISSPQQEADIQQGNFTWRWANQPSSLTSLWIPGYYNIITKGAIMSFENQHNLTADGIAGPAVWSQLLQAAASDAQDPQPYGYVYVTKNLPESVTVYQNGVQAYHTLANTGVPAAPTPDGTWAVDLRYRSTTMSGTNPNGTHYSDPNIPWVSYFDGGIALHGFIRASYGFPQSVGCVEMPPANAAVVWPMTPIGTLVTVA